MAKFWRAVKNQMAENILILGGTKEAALLAERLMAGGHDVTTSLAGRTKSPKPLPGKTRIGGFGGVKGLAIYLATEKITKLIDATHPFAEVISANATEAARQTGVLCYALRRPAWQPQPGDRWQIVETLEAAVDAVPDGATAFLALGSQHIGTFSVRPDCDFVIRMVNQPDEPLSFPARIVFGLPGKDPSVETTLFVDNKITCLVCRNSGGTAGYAKIIAARNLILPVIMIDRPKRPATETYETVDALFTALTP